MLARDLSLRAKCRACGVQLELVPASLGNSCEIGKVGP